MTDCRDIEPALASYVEEPGAAPDCTRIEAHLQACPACRARVERERTAWTLLRARRETLRPCAPERLRQRCAAACSAPSSRAVPPNLASRPWVRLSLAATLVLTGGIFLLFGLGTSVDSYAAQLAADHIKCFTFPPRTAAADAETLGQSWGRTYGWPLRIRAAADAEELELVGIRRCGSTRGRLAHVLYRWRGEPLSVYVLNDRVPGVAEAGHTGRPFDAVTGFDDAVTEFDVVKKFGEQEIIWSDRERTYAVVARASVADLQRVARHVRARIE